LWGGRGGGPRGGGGGRFKNYLLIGLCWFWYVCLLVFVVFQFNEPFCFVASER
jgi:hypothetical protein